MRRKGFTAAEMLPSLRKLNETRCAPPKTDEEVAALTGDVERRYAAKDGFRVVGDIRPPREASTADARRARVSGVTT